MSINVFIYGNKKVKKESLTLTECIFSSAGGVEMAKEYQMYTELLTLLDQCEEKTHSDWCNGLEQTCLANLNQPLLSRDPSSGLITVNFDPRVTDYNRQHCAHNAIILYSLLWYFDIFFVSISFYSLAD